MPAAENLDTAHTRRESGLARLRAMKRRLLLCGAGVALLWLALTWWTCPDCRSRAGFVRAAEDLGLIAAQDVCGP